MSEEVEEASLFSSLEEFSEANGVFGFDQHGEVDQADGKGHTGDEFGEELLLECAAKLGGHEWILEEIAFPVVGKSRSIGKQVKHKKQP